MKTAAEVTVQECKVPSTGAMLSFSPPRMLEKL